MATDEKHSEGRTDDRDAKKDDGPIGQLSEGPAKLEPTPERAHEEKLRLERRAAEDASAQPRKK